MIELRNIEVRYGDFAAIRDLNLRIEQGEFFTLLGPSGCGKTTTLRTLAGFIPPFKGEIRFNGADVTHLRPEERNFGIVFQNYALFPHMSVFENIAFGLRVRREKKAAVRRNVEKYAGMVGVSDHLNKRVTALSGGQQQRVAIARSLIMEPEILLMDEPLSNLDARLRVSMRGEIRNLQRELGITTVYVTHDQEEALILSDRIAVFSRGVVEQVGEPEELYSAPASEAVCCFIGATNLLPEGLVGALRAGWGAVGSGGAGAGKAGSGGAGSGGAGAGAGNRGLEEGRRSYIRKEKIRLLGAGEAAAKGESALAGRVKRVEYSGMNVAYGVEIPDGRSGGNAGNAEKAGRGGKPEGGESAGAGGAPAVWELEVITMDKPRGRFTPGDRVAVVMDPRDIMQFGGDS